MCRQVHRDTDTIWSRALPMGRLQGRLGNLLLQRQTGSDCCLQVGFLSRGGTGSFLFLANFASGRHGWSESARLWTLLYSKSSWSSTARLCCTLPAHPHTVCLPPKLPAHPHTALWKSLFGCDISFELWPDTLVIGWSITAEVFLVLLGSFSLIVVDLLFSPLPQSQLYFRLLAFLRF